MGTHHISIQVSFDEQDSLAELSDIRKTIATALASMYGQDAWSGDTPPMTTLLVGGLVYDIDAGEFLEEHDGLNQIEIELLREGRTIHAIKSLRERTSVSLAEAKGIVDRYRAEHLGWNPWR